MSIYVGNLSYEVTDDDLKSVFAEYGKITRVHLPIDRESGRPRGFAFVEMVDEKEEDAAIEALDEAEWMGRALKVNKAKPREESSGGGGRGGGEASFDECGWRGRRVGRNCCGADDHEDAAIVLFGRPRCWRRGAVRGGR